MSKLLYSQTTQVTRPYPRLDEQPVVGLDPDYLVLTKVETPQPSYDPQTETISSNYVVDTELLQYRQEWIIEQLPTQVVPNWDGFNAYMLSDTMFKSYRDSVRLLDGDLNSALFQAYGLVATNGVSAFTLVWSQWLSLSNIDSADQSTIADVAESFNLPEEFVNVIRAV